VAEIDGFELPSTRFTRKAFSQESATASLLIKRNWFMENKACYCSAGSRKQAHRELLLGETKVHISF
jgi:hypothetical protein